MGSRYLASEDESLVLSPGGDLWVDVDAFEQAVAIARRAEEPATFRAALDLYGGDLLPEDRYEEWTEGRRLELRQLYLALLVELAGLHEERHEHELAIEVLRKLTAEESTSEEAHVALMRLHALSGRPERALAQYERLRDALTRGPGMEPAAPTRRLRDEIAAGRYLPTSSVGPVREESPDAGMHNLSSPMTSFVGRAQEIIDVKRTLAMTRILTLAGAGGSGKTRLAFEVARDLVGAYADGVWMVELAPLSEEGLVAQEVAGALGVTERPGESLADSLVDSLRSKVLLLVLDNCEHLIDTTARLADRLLRSCPRLRILTTSREPLSIAGEAVVQVDPLSLPDRDEPASVEGLMRYEALRLFVDRARKRLPDFELTQQNAGAVARVCRKLDGMPLAIELATARIGALAVEQVAQRLDVSLDILSSANRTAAPRQQTLRATIDWSLRLLSEDEQTIFRRFAVFAGRWTLEAAEAVCSGGDIEQEDVLDLLGGLVDKSLVVAGAATLGTVRYRMLEPIRQYARQELEEIGEAEEVRDRHATFYLALAEAAGPELTGSNQGAWAERLEGEHDNLRAALSWILRREQGELGLRFGGALWRFWYNGGHLSEGERWLEDVLARSSPHPTPARVKALEGMGWLLQIQGDPERARATYEEMLTLSRELGDKGSLATALNSLGTLAVVGGDNERARALLDENLLVLRQLEGEGDPATPLKKFYVFNLLGALAIYEEGDYARGAALWEESLALAREVEDNFLVGLTFVNLGHAALMKRSYERAKAISEQALTLAYERGNGGVELIPPALVNFGLASLGLGEYERARTSFEEALMTSQNSGQKPKVIESLEGMASLAGVLGKNARAVHLWGAAEIAREVTGIVLSSGERSLHEPYLTSARSKLGEAAWEEGRAEGRAMSLEEAAEFALSRETDQPEATMGQEPWPYVESSGSLLTPREQEIALLLARGLTNRQISTKLSVSERTAGNHVAKILKKLGLRSRAQIATCWATDPELPASHPN